MKKHINIIYNPPSPDITKMNYFPPIMAQCICPCLIEITQNKNCEIIFLHYKISFHWSFLMTEWLLMVFWWGIFGYFQFLTIAYNIEGNTFFTYIIFLIVMFSLNKFPERRKKMPVYSLHDFIDLKILHGWVNVCFHVTFQEDAVSMFSEPLTMFFCCLHTWMTL